MAGYYKSNERLSLQKDPPNISQRVVVKRTEQCFRRALKSLKTADGVNDVDIVGN